MKCQLFSRKNKKSIISLSYAESANIMVSVNDIFPFFFIVCVEVLWPSQPNGSC